MRSSINHITMFSILVVLIMLLPKALSSKVHIDYSRNIIYYTVDTTYIRNDNDYKWKQIKTEKPPIINKSDHNCNSVKTIDSVECLIINLHKICSDIKLAVSNCNYKNNEPSYLFINPEYYKTQISADENIFNIYNQSKYFTISEVDHDKQDSNKIVSIYFTLSDNINEISGGYTFISMELLDNNMYKIIQTGVSDLLSIDLE